MTTARLLTYAALGIIAGLLIENKSMSMRYKAGKTAGHLKHRVRKATKQVAKAMS